MTMSLRTRFEARIAEAEAQLVDPAVMASTLDRLVAEGALSPASAASIAEAATQQIERSAYVLRQLGAHIAIGVVFAFDVVPLPLGTVARVGWVGGARLVEEVRGRENEARIHSVAVFLIAAIPWIGYAAYLYPLRREGRELAFVLANQSWLARTGRSFEAALQGTWSPIRRLGRWLVPHPDE